MNNLFILAEVGDISSEGEMIADESTEEVQEVMTKEDGSNGTGQEQAPPPKPGWVTYLPIIAIMAIVYMMLFRGPKKKQQQQQKMVQSLKKNDKVRTIGGILGTVIDVKDDEVTLKIDESNNTKMRVAPGSISRVISDMDS